MEAFSASVVIGWFLGFVFGVGCAMVVLYSIYRSGYRKAVEEAMASTPSARYEAAQAWVREKQRGRIADRL